MTRALSGWKPAVFDWLDEQQGEDPRLLYARERMPEPASVIEKTGHVLIVPLYSPGIADPVSPLYTTERFEAVRIRTGVGRSEFLAWKAARDGKIYI